MDSKTVRILLIEDNPGDARLVRETLAGAREPGFDVTWLGTLAAGLDRLQKDAFDAVLLDLHLPDSKGIETFCRLHESALAVPVILLTGLDDESVALEALRSGAQDYLRKGDACGGLLERTIRYAMERKRIEQELRASENRFHRMAENIQDGLIMLEDGRLVFFNRRACDIFGYSREAMCEQTLWSLLAPEEVESMRAMVAEEIGAGEYQRDAEMWIRRQDGSRRYIQARFSSLQMEDARKSQYIVLTDITERKQREDELQYLSFHDPLTGLYNRGFFEETVDRLERSRQFPVSVIMADVDGLKRVNDGEGHAAGDELLRRAAQALRAVFRADDIIARIGGDEFVVLLPVTDAATLAIILPRVKASIAANQPLSLSLGAATAAEPGGAITHALRQADSLMYQVKAGKRRAHSEVRGGE